MLSNASARGVENVDHAALHLWFCVDPATMCPRLKSGESDMQMFETLGEAAIHAETEALRAYEAAVRERDRHAAQAAGRRDALENEYDAKVDAAFAEWLLAFERRWALA
jgi:hypothetical protein